MTGMEKIPERRASERMDFDSLISLTGQEGMIINISSNGVYFEVVTSSIDAFSPGTTTPIEINTVTSTPGCKERKLRFRGKGSIVRNDIKDITSRGNKLGVALEFKAKLDIFLNES
ncbi:MAG: PilZ domain-containing protein [Candidatus Scalindua sp.]|nr:PilZ domain-containing protein [Candidatus Scalindua sp.]MBT5307254.1 PilZ domain-containing protein [Candidatus Scalindua sp.]MBT6227018.1 PilZ domain-containing protein [Candidatus Scalindua sp.]MBT6562682.1 PilZ domain-containing protein [Candidatus Scalindua sp.]MBT7210222.1 PilZ domain-containing protein [Candidatus Scalindua sp.]